MQARHSPATDAEAKKAKVKKSTPVDAHLMKLRKSRMVGTTGGMQIPDETNVTSLRPR